MPDERFQIRCQRCGQSMTLSDPAPGTPWKPDQFWVCPGCGRHFWSTYATPPGEKPAAAPGAAPAAPTGS